MEGSRAFLVLSVALIVGTALSKDTNGVFTLSAPPPAGAAAPAASQIVIIDTVASTATQLKEKNALLALKAALNDHPVFEDYAHWIALPPGFTADEVRPCYQGWKLITCQNYHITAIDLSNVAFGHVNSSWLRSTDGHTYNPGALTGYIPWDALANITYLTTLNFQQNDISGPNFTEGLSRMKHLTYLNMYLNSLSGNISEYITQVPKLQALDLGYNTITGSIPSTIGNLYHMTNLNLGQNQLTGTIPSSIGNLTEIVRLDLSSNTLTGTLPASIGNLKKMEYFVLDQNPFHGSIPSSWANLTSLQFISWAQCGIQDTFPMWLLDNCKDLNSIFLATNKLYGPIPSKLWSPKDLISVDISNNEFNGSLVLPPSSRGGVTYLYSQNCLSNASTDTVKYPQKNSTTCNSFYAQFYPAPPPPPVVVVVKHSSSSTGAIVGGVCGAIGALVLVFLAFCLYRRRSRKARFSRDLKQAVREFGLTDLKKSTKAWSMLLGKGGYGSVYKCVLKDGTIVAVKRLDQVSKQGDVEFVREVELLSRVHHRHLVNLVGFCAEGGERILVYEYMAMGSLYEHLHGASAKEFPLSWDSRTKIAIHVALGLEYLHYGADPPLIHRDIKSANILLSDDGYSKVADFGLCKEAPLGADGSGGEALVPTATAVRGSFGYLDPEYVNTSVLSEKSDVYSYGVVLLELITGHKSIHEWQPLAYWAEEYLADREKTPLMVDPALEGNFDLDELYALCEIARTCVQDQAVLRPTIRDVAKALVENLGHLGSSYGTSSIGGDSQSLVSATDTSSVTGSSYTAASASDGDATSQGTNTQSFSYQNYSETLHWDKSGSGAMSTSSGSTGISTGKHGNRMPVPVPARPPQGPSGDNPDESV